MGPATKPHLGGPIRQDVPEHARFHLLEREDLAAEGHRPLICVQLKVHHRSLHSVGAKAGDVDVVVSEVFAGGGREAPAGIPGWGVFVCVCVCVRDWCGPARVWWW